jgi:predicted AlkP superfamily phosphohydrolase/phosphomutase
VPEKETLVIGLDGGDFETVKSLIDKNKLPNLKKIVDDGSFMPFTSISSLNSYSAWDSLTLCNKTSLWNELKEKNVSFGTLYWPNVPEQGLFMIPDEFEGKKEWPEDMYDSKALLIFKNPVTELFRKVYWTKIMFPRNKIEKDFVYEFYLLDKKAREYFYLREKFRPEISFLVLSSPLRIEEYFWMYAYPEKFGNFTTEEERERYGKAIEKYFVEFDDFLGKLNKPNKTIIIVSNRGIKEMYPPKIVDKIDINKILKEIGVLEFDYRDEIDFSKTKVYTLEEGLDQELRISINGNPTDLKEKLRKIFDESRSIPSNQKIFIVEDFEKGIILKRNISLIIEDDKFSISGKVLSFNEFTLRKVISTVPEDKSFLIINKKLKFPKQMTSKDFCGILLNLIS